jgi:hypothetical protein
MEQWSDPDPGSGIKHPGSATLLEHNRNSDKFFQTGARFIRTLEVFGTTRVSGCPGRWVHMNLRGIHYSKIKSMPYFMLIIISCKNIVV